MPTIHVKSGIEFRPDLFAKPDPAEWLDAVGQQIEQKGLTIKVGDGAGAKDVKNAADLKAAVGALAQAASAQGVDLKAYVTDLMEALDDVVKPTSQLAAGDVLDLTTSSDLAKALGLADTNAYAAPATDYGKRPDGVLSVLSVRLQNTAVAPDPLAGVPFIDATLGGGQLSTGRDSLEVEATRCTTGVSKEELYKLLTTKDDKGHTVLHKLQKNDDSVAFGIGYQGMSLDEVAWDSTSAKVREMNPYISLTVEGGRMELDPKSGDREVTVGRDTFWDAIYATKDPVKGVLTRDMMNTVAELRTRLRCDADDGKPTRVLIQVKLGTVVDDTTGLKSDAKVDIRTDSPTDDTVAHLDESVKTGKLQGAGWYPAGGVIDAVAQLYRYLGARGALRSYGPHKDVLVLDKGGYVRQVRGRYHLNETEPGALTNAFQQCGAKLNDILALINGSPSLDAATKADLAAKCNALVDRSEIVKRATEGLKKLDPAMNVDKAAIDALWPDQPLPSDKMQVKKRKVVADAIDAAYRDFTGLLGNDVEQKIAGNADKKVRKAGSFDDVKEFLQAKSNASKFMTWAQSQQGSGVVAGKPETFKAYLDKVNAMPEADKEKLLLNSGLASKKLKKITLEMLSPLQVPANLERTETVHPFLAEFDAKLAGPDKAAFVAELAAFLKQNGNDALDKATDKDAVLADIRKNIVFEDLEVLHRMVEQSATFAQTLWFDSVRSAYCNVRREGWSNFIIDSFDLTEEYDVKHGDALTQAQRGSRDIQDPANMLALKIGSDFQIELGYEEPYTKAIDAAKRGIASATAGLFMDYALQKQGSGVNADDAASFAKYLDAQLALPAAGKKAFLDEVAAFAKQKGSVLPMDEQALSDVAARAKTISLLGEFAAAVPGSNVNPAQPATLKAWLDGQLGWNQSADKKSQLLNDLTKFFASKNVEKAWTEKKLQALDFLMLDKSNQGKPVDGHGQLLEDLQMTTFVWDTLNKTQDSLQDLRGKRVVDEAKKHGVSLAWQAPPGSKGDETLEQVID